MKSKPEELSRTIPRELAGQRLDQALATLFSEHSRARLQHWIREGRVQLNDRVVSQRHKLIGGEQVRIRIHYATQSGHSGEPIPLDIMSEDDHLIVVNKPAGLVVHPGAGNPQHTLLNALLNHCPSLDKVARAGIVHRLDKDTTGLMVIAKTPVVHTRLVEAMQARLIQRNYLALVRGELIAGGVVDAPIGRHPARRVKMAVQPRGKPARTHYRITERLPGFSLLECRLESGRTHQIRVHMAHLHHPIVGDPLYGGRSALPAGCPDSVRRAIRGFRRQALHATSLELTHPVSAETVNWQAPLPADFQDLLQEIRDA
ncbi:MAG: 23S rRNA pseudouridine(1911/1915/1917) synthase RluD [Thiotrichales bacterium]|nr:23S rRNA pseudouridine(1911/1915/1917) synthase RluD [Thiotrichales bacterium]